MTKRGTEREAHAVTPLGETACALGTHDPAHTLEASMAQSLSSLIVSIWTLTATATGSKETIRLIGAPERVDDDSYDDDLPDGAVLASLAGKSLDELSAISHRIECLLDGGDHLAARGLCRALLEDTLT